MLTACAALACGPAPPASPEAQGLVLVRLVGPSTEIVRVRLSDGASQAVTDTPERGEWWPYWSPAAGRLLFQAGRDGSHDLFLWDPASGEETALVRTPDRDERWHGWSPGGERVVYAFHGGAPAAGIAVSRPADGKVSVLASSGARDFFFRPHFAPDGRRLVVQRRGPEGRGSHLWLLAAGAEPRPLTRDPAWFDFKGWFVRDGSRIVYSRRIPRQARHEIVWIDASGSDLRVLAGGEGVDVHSARPSPTRDEIAFVSQAEGSYDVFLADLSGGAPRALTRTPDRNEFAPRWSPDGERILVTTTPVGAGMPRLAKREGLEEATVTALNRNGRALFSTPGFMPDWMPPWP